MGIPITQVEQRRELLLELLPSHNWSITQAGIAAGYSRDYARSQLARTIKKDIGFSKRIYELRKQKAVQPTNKRERCERRLLAIVDDPDSRNSDVIGAVTVIGRMNAWLSERQIIETPQRARELADAERREAERLALLRFDTRALPEAQPAIDVSFEPAGDSAGPSADGTPEPPNAGDDNCSPVSPSIEPGLETGQESSEIDDEEGLW